MKKDRFDLYVFSFVLWLSYFSFARSKRKVTKEKGCFSNASPARNSRIHYDSREEWNKKSICTEGLMLKAIQNHLVGIHGQTFGTDLNT